MPGPSSATGARRRPTGALRTTVTVPPAGEWRIALSSSTSRSTGRDGPDRARRLRLPHRSAGPARATPRSAASGPARVVVSRASARRSTVRRSSETASPVGGIEGEQVVDEAAPADRPRRPRPRRAVDRPPSHEPFAVEHLRGRPDDRRGRPDLMGGVGHEPSLGIEGGPDRHERPIDDDDRDEGGAEEAEPADDHDRQDQRAGLPVMEREDVARLDVPGGLAIVGDGHRQETDRDVAGLDGAKIAPGSRRGGDGVRIGQAVERDARWVGDHCARGVQDEEERVGRGGSVLRQFVTAIGRVAVRPCGGSRGVTAREERVGRGRQCPVHVVIERPDRGERRDGADGDDERGDECEDDHRQAETRPCQEARVRIGARAQRPATLIRRAIMRPPAACSRHRGPCGGDRRGRAPRACAGGMRRRGPRRWSRRPARPPTLRRGSAAG